MGSNVNVFDNTVNNNDDEADDGSTPSKADSERSPISPTLYSGINDIEADSAKIAWKADIENNPNTSIVVDKTLDDINDNEADDGNTPSKADFDYSSKSITTRDEFIEDEAASTNTALKADSTKYLDMSTR